MDRYSLNARIYPVVIFYMPAIILAVLFSFKFESYVHLLTSFGIVGALSYLFSQLGRDGGKKREKYLWKSWGGAPTIQLLRWRDTEININTKKRYHSKLNSVCALDIIPDVNFEQNNPEEADDAYQAWTKFLISKTRDNKKFSVLFKENINYGFRRNLWGMKAYSLTLIFVLMVATFLYYNISFHTFDIFLYPMEFIIAEILLLIILLLWIFIITRNWIKLPAFAYAERLLEASEEIS